MPPTPPRDAIEFNFGDSGKTAYFAVQIGNEGKKALWGPQVQAFVFCRGTGR
jgi:hypothetical protein